MSQAVKTLSVVVCKGPTCSAMDSAALQSWAEDLQGAGLPVHTDVTNCTGNCLEAPVVAWNGRYLTETSPEQLTARLIDEGLL